MKRPNRETLSVASVELLEAADGLRPFFMLANTGAEVARIWGRAIFDISGVETGPKVPILLDHDSTQRAGFADEITMENSIELRGFLSPSTKAGVEVATLSDEGFPWQASIQLIVSKWEELEAGTKAKVNGREVVGPISIARQSRLIESSFLMAGADKDTHAVALAAEETRMDPKAFEAAHPEAVKAWREESAKLAATETRKGLGEFLAAFPGREAWAAGQFAAGKSAIEAKAALADVLQAELNERAAAPVVPAVDPKVAKDAATLAALTAQAQPGVGFNGQLAQGDDDPKAAEALMASLPLEERCGIEWLSDEKLRTEFANKFQAYLAYERRAAEGTAV